MSSQHIQRRPWTKVEDQLLTALIAVHGCKRGRPSESKWTEVSKHMPGRTNKDCRKRWFHSLDPSLRKGRWTKEEDDIILAAYARMGPSWKEIALLLQGRKDDQVAKRYNDILSPAVRDRLSSWSEEEDRYLTEQVTKCGHRWASISTGLPGRPPLTCRNRWRYLSRTRRSEQHQPIDSSPEQSCSVSSARLSLDPVEELPASINSPSSSAWSTNMMPNNLEADLCNNDPGIEQFMPLPNFDLNTLGSSHFEALPPASLPDSSDFTPGSNDVGPANVDGVTTYGTLGVQFQQTSMPQTTQGFQNMTFPPDSNVNSLFIPQSSSQPDVACVTGYTESIQRLPNSAEVHHHHHYHHHYYHHVYHHKS